MRNTIVILVIMLFVTSCNQEKTKSTDYLLGNWKGYYKDETIELSFKKDSFMTITYYSNNTQSKTKYRQIGNKLIMYLTLPDTCYIKQTNKDSLILIPVEQFREDILELYLVKYKRLK